MKSRISRVTLGSAPNVLQIIVCSSIEGDKELRADLKKTLVEPGRNKKGGGKRKRSGWKFIF